ncbi:hypothetical protein SteCoe_29163 [Stentor coeruleus]|uniref:GAR domain-containing protein n=1 Tax=Stentor coeruleus TaxID=5963 RepID=A0A1R2B713_9CILI|nr:hypothetical protein SteCoe_29163 [Stentor coeruleus]
MASEYEIEIGDLALSPEVPFEVFIAKKKVQKDASVFATNPVPVSMDINGSIFELVLNVFQNQTEYSLEIAEEAFSGTLTLVLRITPVVEDAQQPSDSLYNCRYLRNISASESYYESTKNILTSLEEMMGENYQKMLDDVVRPPSPSRSPVRKNTKPGGKTPGKTPSKSPYKRSFSGLSFDQGGLVEIPCNEEIFMDRVSGKDSHSLMLVVAGLLARRRLLKVSDDEDIVLKGIIDNNAKACQVMKEAFEETKAQIASEKEDIQKKIQAIKDIIAGLENRLGDDKEKNKELEAEKNKISGEVKECLANIEILKSVNVDDAEQILENVMKVRAEGEKAEQQRKELQDEFMEYMAKFRSEMAEKDREVSRKQDQLNKAIAEFNQKDVQLTHLVQDNAKLQTQVLDNTSKLVVKISQHDRVKLLNDLVTKDTQAVGNLKEKLQEILSKFEEIKKATSASISDIQYSKESLDRTQEEVKAAINSKNQEHEELVKNITLVSENLHEIRSLYDKTSQIEQHFTNLQKRLLFSYENKEHAVREMKYLSDLILHLTSCYTAAHRSYNKSTALLDQKNCEVITIHKALEELKKKYPVYFPIKEDPLDMALGNYLNQRELGLAVPFIREGGGVYIFGTRKILVNYERGKLTVKVGGGFLPIEEFIHAYSDIEVEKFVTKCQELSPKTKKFLGKWVGGFVDNNLENAKKMKEMLVQAAEDHKYSVSYGVKNNERTPSPQRKSRTSFS